MVRVLGPFTSESVAKSAATTAINAIPENAYGTNVRWAFHAFKIRVFKPVTDKDGKVSLTQGFDWYVIIYATACCVNQ